MGCGKRIKEVRLLLDLKQKELAAQMRISSSYLSGVESEIKQANANIIFTLINQYEVNSEWLQYGTGEIFIRNGNYVYIKAAEVADNMPKYNLPMLKFFIEEELNTKSDKLNYYVVSNDNMNPTIRKGDVVFVDKSDNFLENEGVYLLETDEKKFLRRLVLVPEKHLANDNQNIKHGSILPDSTIKCIGRLVWFSRKI